MNEFYPVEQDRWVIKIYSIKSLSMIVPHVQSCLEGDSYDKTASLEGFLLTKRLEIAGRGLWNHENWFHSRVLPLEIFIHQKVLKALSCTFSINHQCYSGVPTYWILKKISATFVSLRVNPQRWRLSFWKKPGWASWEQCHCERAHFSEWSNLLLKNPLDKSWKSFIIYIIYLINIPER